MNPRHKGWRLENASLVPGFTGEELAPDELLKMI